MTEQHSSESSSPSFLQLQTGNIKTNIHKGSQRVAAQMRQWTQNVGQTVKDAASQLVKSILLLDDKDNPSSQKSGPGMLPGAEGGAGAGAGAGGGRGRPRLTGIGLRTMKGIR